MHKFPFKVIQGNLAEGRCSLVRETSQLGDSWGEVAGSWGQVDYRQPYWRHPGAKFGHFVGDVEAKSGYGDARIEATFWAQIGATFGHLGPC